MRRAKGAKIVVAVRAPMWIACFVATTSTSCLHQAICASSSDCTGGRVCTEGRCATPCNDARACAPDEICSNGSCVADTNGQPDDDDDAGAAIVDDGGAGTNDAGAHDAGLLVVDGGATIRDAGIAPIVDAGCEPAIAWRDADLDGYTTTSTPVCAGAPLAPDLRAERRGAPFVGVFGAVAQSEAIGDFNDDPWENDERARLLSGLNAICDGVDGNDLSEYLVVHEYALGVPETATITGIEVRVHRIATTSSIVDASLRLVIPGATAGTASIDGVEHASTAAWSTTALEEAVYGGPGDLWGLALTPQDVNRPEFGAALSVQREAGAALLATAEVDLLSVRIYTADGDDCDDGDPVAFFARPAFVDFDEDSYGDGALAPACLGAPLMPARQADRAGDCYDGNDLAHPYATAYHAEDRGDGSFDYNCDDNTTHPAITSATQCNYDAVNMVCTTTYVNITEAGCGQDNAIGQCDATCALVAATATTVCR